MVILLLATVTEILDLSLRLKLGAEVDVVETISVLLLACFYRVAAMDELRGHLLHGLLQDRVRHVLDKLGKERIRRQVRRPRIVRQGEVGVGGWLARLATARDDGMELIRGRQRRSIT